MHVEDNFNYTMFHLLFETVIMIMMFTLMKRPSNVNNYHKMTFLSLHAFSVIMIFFYDFYDFFHY